MYENPTIYLMKMLEIQTEFPDLNWDEHFDFWYYRCLAHGGVPTA